MSEHPDWEILPAGEMQKKYGLYAENKPIVKLNPEKVPASLRHLIPLAEKWGITDSIMRLDFRKKSSEADREELRREATANEDDLEKWLCGPASYDRSPSLEYVTFSAMLMANDGC